jgi:hypothetical protein
MVKRDSQTRRFFRRAAFSALAALPATLTAGEWTPRTTIKLAPVSDEQVVAGYDAAVAEEAGEVAAPSISESIANGCGSCGDCCNACDDCCKPCCICPPGRIWLRGETLLWWADGMDVPPLVTLGNVNNGAALGPGTSILYGGDAIDSGLLVGGRFEGGVWLDECQTVAIQGGGFFLGQGGENFSVGSDGSAVIGRPFFNADAGRQDAELVSFPDSIAGVVNVGSSMTANGANVGVRKNLLCASCPTCFDSCDPCGSRRSWFEVPKLRCCRVDVVGGFTYFGLDDDLVIGENLVALAGNQQALAAGTNILVVDDFRTENRFFGGQIGFVADVYRGRWWFELGGQVALGTNYREVRINGGTTVIDPTGDVVSYNGGLLAQSSNIGKYEDTAFCVIPQVDLRVGYQVTKCLRVYTGYTFLYLSNVVRAGDQIDATLNPNLIPPQQDPVDGPLRPAFSFQDSDFWLQGVMLGAEVRF